VRVAVVQQVSEAPRAKRQDIEHGMAAEIIEEMADVDGALVVYFRCSGETWLWEARGGGWYERTADLSPKAPRRVEVDGTAGEESRPPARPDAATAGGGRSKKSGWSGTLSR
jgi:hypothetical protein